MGYNIQVSNNKYPNLAYGDQIYNMTLVETVGNFLPMFKLSFRDQDYEKLQYLNELNPIMLSYQIDEELISNQFIIKQTKPVLEGVAYNCSIGGYLNKFEYFKGLPKVPYITGTSIEAITQQASAYFAEVDISENIVIDDKMNWIHNGMNARNFIQDIWKHMYSPDSLPLISIGLDGKFKMYDLTTLLAQEPKYRFTCNKKEGYETYISATTENSSLENTSMFGYTSERDIIQEGTLEEIKSLVSPQVVMNTSNTLNEQPDMPTKRLAPMIQSSNVHKNWYTAFHQNLVRWSTLNNNKVRFTLHNNLLPLDTLDLVYIELPEQGFSGKNVDGNFIISRKELIFNDTGEVTIVYTGIREVGQNTAVAEDQTETKQTQDYRI